MAEGSFSQDQFSCSLCRKVLKDPVTFPCGHSYCKSCITHCWKDEIGGYSCSRCTFTPGPALGKNVIFDWVVGKLLLQICFHCNTESLDVECDVCTDTKCKAVKSCLGCVKSFCQNHLEQHESIFQDNKHNLMDPTTRLKEMICPKHKKPLEIYCRTDQQCICYPCTVEGHKNHEVVTVVAERTEKQVWTTINTKCKLWW